MYYTEICETHANGNKEKNWEHLSFKYRVFNYYIKAFQEKRSKRREGNNFNSNIE